MRLIDELLKDDFFHGGFQPAAPGAAQAAAANTQAPGSPGKKPVILIAGIAAGVLVVGLGVTVFLMSSGSKPAEAPPPAAAPAAPVAQAPAPAAPAAPAQPAAAAPAPDAAAPAAPAPAAAEPVAAAPVAQAPTPPPTPSPPAAPAEPAAATPTVDLSTYTLSISKLTDRAKAEKVVAALGSSAKLRDESKKSTEFRVVSTKLYPPAEAKAVEMKASIFKVTMKTEPQPSGEVLYVFGSYDNQLDAAMGGGKAKPIGVPTTVQKKETASEAYFVDVEPSNKEEADRRLSALSAIGVKAKLKKVK